MAEVANKAKQQPVAKVRITLDYKICMLERHASEDLST